MSDHKGVLVLGESAQDKLAQITLELLGIGRKLADDLGEDLRVLLMGSKAGSLAKEAIAYGADKVYVADDGILDKYNSDAYTQVAAKVCQNNPVSIMLLGHTDVGIDLAPRLNARLRGGLAMECTALSLDPATKLLVSTRPVYGGNAIATMVSKSARPQMATLRAKIVSPALRNDSRKGEVIPVDKVDTSAIKINVIEKVKEEVEGVKLEDAEVVVCGGRGVGSAQNFELLKKLASLLGGAVGGTRPACEEKWVPMSQQIGQTGKIVSPKVYFAIALSGAMQHVAGCSRSKTIVAINKDPEANIFKVAHLGIVGDYKEALPAMTDKLKQLMGK